MPLHLDYRPRTFDEIVGNKETVTQLRAHMKKASPNHSLLFYGPPGCGKTTFARLIATLLECPPEMEDGRRNIDYQEIDSASDRGIDTAREIRSKINIRPLSCPVRVYVFDEAHGMTTDAQRAYLKALEDGYPKWVWLILCTTEPERLSSTVKRRCTKFEVEPLAKRDMTKLLEWVLEEEDEDEFPEKVMKDIINAADGSPGEALVLLDSVIDLSIEDMGDAVIRVEERKRKTIELIHALMQGAEWPKIRLLLASLEGEPEERIRRAVLGYISKVVLNDDKAGNFFLKIYDAFRDPFFNTGKAGLVFACLEIVGAENDIPF